MDVTGITLRPDAALAGGQVLATDAPGCGHRGPQGRGAARDRCRRLLCALTRCSGAVVGGSWITPAEALATANWKHITRLGREATALANG